MKTFVIGSKDLSVRILSTLLEQGHEVLGVFSRDDEPSMKVWHNDLGHDSLKLQAESRNIPAYEGMKVNSEEAQKLLRSLNLDIIFSCFWSEIIKQETLDIPRLGIFNLHTAYLPLNRGSRPIPWSLIEGEPFTGLTIHKMASGVDNGPIVSQVQVEITNQDTGKTLYERVTAAGIQLFRNTLPAFSGETIQLQEQIDNLSTYHPRGEPFGGQVNAFWTNDKKDRFRRAFNFHPFRGHREAPLHFRNGKSPQVCIISDPNLKPINLPPSEKPWKRNDIGNPKEREILKTHFKNFQKSGIIISEHIAGMFPVLDVLKQMSFDFVVSKTSDSIKWLENIESHQPLRYENGLLEIPAIHFHNETQLNDCLTAAEEAVKQYNRDIFIGVITRDSKFNLQLSEQTQKIGGLVLTFSEVYHHFNTEYENISA